MKFVLLAVSSLAVAAATHQKAKKVKVVKAKPNKKGYSAIPIGQTPVALRCPLGYDLEGDSCSRTLTTDLVPYCLDGDMRGEECATYAPPELTCPYDTVLLGNICSRTVTTDIRVRCPPHYTMSSGKHMAECFREIAQPSVFRCPHGTEDFGGRCVSYNFVEPIAVCPDGTEMIGDECLTTRVYDCTTYGHHGKHGGHGGHHRMLKGKKGFGKKDKKAVYIPTPTVVTEVVAQQCEETVVVPPTLICPDGSETHGHGCRIPNYTGQVEEMVASLIDTIAPIAQCDAGYYACGGKHGKHGKHGDECCRTEELPATPVCPTGFYEDGIQCVHAHPVEYQCMEPGYVRQGDMCLIHDFIAPIGEYTVTYQCEGYECGINNYTQGYGHTKKGGHH